MQTSSVSRDATLYNSEVSCRPEAEKEAYQLATQAASLKRKLRDEEVKTGIRPVMLTQGMTAAKKSADGDEDDDILDFLWGASIGQGSGSRGKERQFTSMVFICLF